MSRIPQAAFSRGEVSPELYGRSDMDGYFLGLRTARNMTVRQQGGVYNRAGFYDLGPARYADKATRLVKFEFGSADTHILEFGDEYIRFMRDDGHITETPVDITGVTAADPVEVTTDGAHGFSTGEEVFLSSIGGMVEISGNRYLVTSTGSDTFTLRDQVDGTDVDGTGFTAYTSGGTAAVILTITSPYSEGDLPFLKFNQSFDVLKIAREGKPRKQLRRLALDNWELVDVGSLPEHPSPSPVTATAASGSGDTRRYVVTAIAEQGEEESLTALATGTSFTISDISNASPATVTFASSPSGLNTGHEIFIDNVVGMTELNGRRYRVIKTGGATYQLDGIDSTDFTAYVSGGTANPAYAEADGDTSADFTVSWAAVPNTVRYVVYKEKNGVFALLGETTNTSFVDDDSIEVNLDDTALFYADPFFAEANAPICVGTHAQKQVYAGSFSDPSVTRLSRTGSFDNFSRSFPAKPDDAFTFRPDFGKYNQMRSILSLRDLLLFSNSTVWSVSSGNEAFTFSNLVIRAQTPVGASFLDPLAVNDSRVVFEEESGERVQSLRFEFAARDGYALTDLSLYSSHLLENDRIVDWEYVSWPDPLIMMVMESGRMLSLTYNPEENTQVTGWARWDTLGKFKSVAAVRPNTGTKHSLAYVVVERVINGRTVQRIERQDARVFSDVRDTFFLDAGARYDIPLTVLSISDDNPTSIGVTGHGLSNGDFVDFSDIKWNVAADAKGVVTQPSLLNGRRFVVRNASTDAFNIEYVDGDELGNLVDGTDFPTYLEGGVVRKAVTRLTGLFHLANTTVVGLLDGDVQRGIEIDENGGVDLPVRSSRVNLGLPYVSDTQALRLDTSKQEVKGWIKQISRLALLVGKTRGMLIGPDENNLTEWEQREFENYGEPTRLKTGTIEVPITADWSFDGSVFIRQVDPLPIEIQSIVPDARITK